MFGMMWYGLLIPVVITIFLFAFHRKATAWWELVVIWAVSLVVIVVAQVTVQHFAVQDKEYWGNLGVKVQHDEPWAEWKINGCSRQVPCGQTCTGTGSSRSCTTKYCTQWYDCLKSYSRKTYLVNRRNSGMRVSYSKYKELVKRWGTGEEFIDMKREKNHNVRSHGAYDGDRYICKWDKDPFTSEPIVSEHWYENRVAASDSILNFADVSEEDVEFYGLHEYPDVPGWLIRTIMDTKNWKKPDKYFQYLNGKLGPERFLRIWVLVFRGQADRIAAYKQVDYWKNGNKNEFIYCIGVDKADNILWGETISWTEKEDLKIEGRNFIENEMGDKLTDDSLMALAKHAEATLGKRYVKPEFTEKYSHLSVTPSITAIMIGWSIIALINLGIVIWVIKNEFKMDQSSRSRDPNDRPLRGMSKTKKMKPTRRRRTSKPIRRKR